MKYDKALYLIFQGHVKIMRRLTIGRAYKLKDLCCSLEFGLVNDTWLIEKRKNCNLSLQNFESFFLSYSFIYFAKKVILQCI